jgi:molecular chaperone DnaJ
MAEDYYKILGLDKNASKDEIKKAYRKMAHKYHPDKESGDAELFKKVNEAHEVLSDDQKRSQYDQFGQVFSDGGMNGGGGGFNASGFDFSNMGGFSDIFEDFFSGGSMGGSSYGSRSSRQRTTRGQDIEMHQTLTFMEAVFGVEKNINLMKLVICSDCEGSGAKKDSKIVTCPECNGTGHIKKAQRTILGNIMTTTVCTNCNGTGEYPEVKCPKCHGQGRFRENQQIKVQIPAGVDNGSTIRVTGKGEAGMRGGLSGDLYIHIIVKEHQEFRRDGYDIRTILNITIAQAVLGDEIKINTIDGEMVLKVPAGIQSGKTLKISGKGVSVPGKKMRGDHLIKVIVVIPENLSSAELDVFKELAEITNKDIKPQRKSGIFW